MEAIFGVVGELEAIITIIINVIVYKEFGFMVF